MPEPQVVGTINTSHANVLDPKSMVWHGTKRTRGRAWMKVIAAVKKRDKMCVACKAQGKVAVINEIDHILPIHKGGTDAMDNLQGLCIDCHKAKTTGKPSIGVDGWPLP